MTDQEAIKIERKKTAELFGKSVDEIERLKEALRQIANTSAHLDDAEFEEVHGTKAYVMRRYARLAIENKED